MPRRTAAILTAPVIALVSACSDTGSRPTVSVATVDPCPAATGSATSGPAFLDSSGRTLEDLAETPAGAGFADLELCRRTDEILLWWKGDVPAEAQAQIDALPVRVVVRVALHSSRELAAIEAGLDDNKDFWERSGFQIEQRTRRPGGAGVVVAVSGAPDGPAAAAIIAGRLGGDPPVEVVEAPLPDMRSG